MAQLVALVVSDDDAFRKQIGRTLRAGAIPVSVIEETSPRDGVACDIVIADIRRDPASAMGGIERLRAAAPGAGLFVVALENDPEVILEAMRAGANEFFAWPPPDE